MISELLRKLFGLNPISCLTCEVLRDQLDKSEGERKELLARLLEKDKPELVTQSADEPRAITPQFTPWRVRQQMLEQEDRKKAQLMRDRQKEIYKLEKELGVKDAVHGSDAQVETR
jgi:hypothetical protein